MIVIGEKMKNLIPYIILILLVSLACESPRKRSQADADRRDQEEINKAESFNVDSAESFNVDSLDSFVLKSKKSKKIEHFIEPLGYNSIGVPTFTICFANGTTKTVKGIEFSVKFKNNFNEEVCKYGTCFMSGIFQEDISPESKRCVVYTAHGFDNATKIVYSKITRVAFEDGTIVNY